MASPTSRGGAEAVPPVLPSIPLAPEPVKPLSEQSIGSLVKEATAHVSTLVRAEVELARAEVTAEVKKGLQGSIFFIVALAIVLFSLFFLFFTIAELIAIWLTGGRPSPSCSGSCSWPPGWPGSSATCGCARSASRSGRSRSLKESAAGAHPPRAHAERPPS